MKQSFHNTNKGARLILDTKLSAKGQLKVILYGEKHTYNSIG